MWFDRFHKIINCRRLRGPRTILSNVLDLLAGAVLLLPGCTNFPPATDARQSTVLQPETDTSSLVRFAPQQAGKEQLSGCIEDTTSGLVWEVKKNNGGLRDAQHKFTWRVEDNRVNGGFSGYRDGGNCAQVPCDTQGYIDAVNQLRLCGMSHWRLPTRAELGSLVDFRIRYPGPVINSSLFPNTIAQFYWSASPDANDADSAWGVGFAFGYDYAYFKNDAALVRLVHDVKPVVQTRFNSGPVGNKQHCPSSIIQTSPTSRFTSHHNGTATDNQTSLTWMRCLAGQAWQNGSCSGKPDNVNLLTARTQAQLMVFAGKQDWRLPSIDELGSITELGCESPAINLEIFPGEEAANIWSSTPFINDPDYQWLVQFKYGENHIDKSTIQAQVRLVHGKMKSANSK